MNRRAIVALALSAVLVVLLPPIAGLAVDRFLAGAPPASSWGARMGRAGPLILLAIAIAAGYLVANYWAQRRCGAMEPAAALRFWTARQLAIAIGIGAILLRSHDFAAKVVLALALGHGLSDVWLRRPGSAPPATGERAARHALASGLWLIGGPFVFALAVSWLAADGRIGPDAIATAAVGGVALLAPVRDLLASYLVEPGAEPEFQLSVKPGEIVAIRQPDPRLLRSIAGALAGDPGLGRVSLVDPARGLRGQTVAEAIAEGQPGVSTAEVLAAAGAAGVTAFLPYLPHGMNSRLDDPDAILAEGQRRRILLARALLERPSVLVLVDVFANIDTDAAGRIWRSLEAGRAARSAIVLSSDSELPGVPDRLFTLG